MYLRRSTSVTASPEFKRVYRKGSVYKGRLFSVHVLPNALGRARLGLSVSKRVGTAVKRNRIRRRLKEIFHSAAKDLPGDLDLVISVRPASAEASFEELNTEFLCSLRRINEDMVARESGEGS